MYRRELLRKALAAGLTATPLSQLADVLTQADQALADPGQADLGHLEAVTEQHSYGYGGRAPTDVLADLIADFADVTPLLQRPQPAATRIALSRVMGHGSARWHDRRGPARSRQPSRGVRLVRHRYPRRRGVRRPVAARLDPRSQGDGAAQLRRPPAAADLAEQARRAAGTGATAAATLAAAVAGRAYALAGRRDDATTALRAADQLAAALPDGERADTWFGDCEQKHHVHLSHALTALGDTSRARESQAHALALSAPTSTLTRTLLRLDAATCQHRDGHTLDACQAATVALTDVPVRFRTGLTRSRAVDLYRSVPADLRSAPPVRGLADVLAA
jgi:hypothetical protein